MLTTSQFVSEQEYLAKERNSDQKFEYENGKLIPTGGASIQHNIIISNLQGIFWEFRKKIKDITSCSNDLRVFIPSEERYYYPDLVICQGEKKFLDDSFDTLLNPSIIIEVLSKGTETRDRSIKFEAYRSIPSFVEYLLISQEEPKIESFMKNASGEWVIQTPMIGLDQTFQFEALPLEMSLSDVFLDIKWV